MKNSVQDALQALIRERNRIATDLKNDPIATNYEGKELPKEPTAYLIELDRKIATLQKGN